MTTTTTHGGRRHGLDPEGRAARVGLVLDQAALALLAELAATQHLTRSEVVRRLLLHPDAAEHAAAADAVSWPLAGR